MENQDELGELIARFNRAATVPTRNPKPSAEQVAAAEDALGCRLPPSYVRFLRSCHAGTLRFWSTYWVGSEPRRSGQSQNIVRENEKLRAPSGPWPGWPRFLVAFQTDSGGNLNCFDSRGATDDGEWPIVFWDHELPAEDNVADLDDQAHSHRTFAAWLEGELENAEDRLEDDLDAEDR